MIASSKTIKKIYSDVFKQNILKRFSIFLFTRVFQVTSDKLVNQVKLYLKSSSNLNYIKNESRNIFRTISNIYDVTFNKNKKQLFTVHYFCKKAASQMFDRVLYTPLVIPNL